jgi:hypothetical protein
MLTFEALPGTISGSGQVTVVDPALGTPIMILKLADAWSVKVDFTIAGEIPLGWIGGKWHVQAFLERMGPGADLIVNAAPQTQVISGLPVTFLITPDGGLPVEEGMYRLAVSILFRDAGGNPKPVAAFQDGPTLQFYT